MSDYSKDFETARKIAELADKIGGTVYFVGGYVRDRLRGVSNKDIDIEVHGLSPAQLCGILDSIGERLNIGQSFGIYGLKGCSVDIAMPRKEALRGSGHRDFEITVDPFIGTKKAAVRRDFTINALMENVLTGEVVDHFGGLEDLRAGILRHVNAESFTEDALRVLRCAQFASRFGFTVAPETIRLCRSMELSHLPKERIMGELEKALLKAEKPSVFFETLRNMDQLSTWFPEVEALIGVEQSKHHPEGDVWNHTMLVLDQAAGHHSQVSRPLYFMLSALCHDFGKPVTTERINGAIHAYGHETAGLPIVTAFLHRLSSERELERYVLNMVELHMRPNILAADQSAPRSTNRVFDRSVDPEALILLASSDALGKTGSPTDHMDWLQQRLAQFRTLMAQPQVMGRDLIEAGLIPDAHFSDYLAYAHKLHLSGISKADALRQTLGYARSKK